MVGGWIGGLQILEIASDSGNAVNERAAGGHSEHRDLPAHAAGTTGGELLSRGLWLGGGAPVVRGRVGRCGGGLGGRGALLGRV